MVIVVPELQSPEGWHNCHARAGIDQKFQPKDSIFVNAPDRSENNGQVAFVKIDQPSIWFLPHALFGGEQK
jgi:hypothetical protein